MQLVHVLTNRYDNSRSGVNLAETKLAVANINVSQFGKLFTRPVDGDLYAQPLIVSGMTVGGATCNVVFLATSRNTVYAYEADDPEACLPLWSRNLGPPVPRDDVLKKLGQTYHYLNFANEIGITGTPAIELDGGTLYVVAKTRRITDLGGAMSKTYSHTIHALDLATGEDKPIPNNPMEIRATALKSDGSTITFDPLFQLNRPGLLLLNEVLYIAFGSHGDFGKFYGWIMAYDAATLVQRAVYCTAPDWTEGGVWQSGCGLAGDDNGFVYAVVGNGERPSDHPDRVPDITSATGIQGPVFGNSILKLKLTGTPGADESLEVADWYTAPDVMDLNENDNDIMGGPVLLEAPGADGPLKRLVLAGGKDGRFYLLDRGGDGMGKWAPMTGGQPSHWDKDAKHWVAWQGGKRPKNAVQDDKVCNYHIHGAPIIWRNPSGGVISAYVWSEQDALKALQLQQGRFIYDKTLKTSTSAYSFPQDEMRMPGGFLALSADGETEGTAIVWASHPTDDDAMNKTVKGTLRAFDARDLSVELWNSDQDADGSDRVGFFAKFNTPVVANGKVYLATFSRELAVYGLYADIGTTRLIPGAGIFEIGGFGANIDGNCIATCSRYDITASGEGLKGKSDSFFFAYRVIDLDEQPRVSIAARLVGLNNLSAVSDNPNAIAGVMIRKFRDGVPSARYAAGVITADNRVLLLSRSKDGAAATKHARPTKAEPRPWLRLSCAPASTSGSFSFQAEIAYERDVWERLGDSVVIPMDGRVMVGLAATAQVTPSPSPTDPTPQAYPKVQARFAEVLVTPVT